MMSTFLSILLALLVFGLLIFIHELGHFLVARACGVEILEFAIGMGPKIFSHKSKKSGIVYSLRAFPIGGFVSMLGESGMELAQGGNGQEDDPSVDAGDDRGYFSTTEEREALTQAEREEETEAPTLSEVDPERAKRAYCNQSVWKRILISVAGPFMNILLGFVLTIVFILLLGINALGGTTVAGFYEVYNGEEAYYGIESGDYFDTIDGIRVQSLPLMKEQVSSGDGFYTVTVLRQGDDGTVSELTFEEVPLIAEWFDSHITSSLSEASGLAVGDRILRINGVRVHTYNEISYEMMYRGYKPLKITVLRDGEKVTLDAVRIPSFSDSGATFGDPDFLIYREEALNFEVLMRHAWCRSVSTVKMVFDSLQGLFSGRFGVEAVSGPVGITKTISDAAKTGYENVLYLVIVISINLGVMNLLPIPAMDGGHLLLYVIEAIRGKKMRPELEGIINFVGLILILGLAVVITIKDVISL